MNYRMHDTDSEKTSNSYTVREDSMNWDEPSAPHVLQPNTSRARAYARHSNLLTHAGVTKELYVTVLSRSIARTTFKSLTL
jgi:hypothetical protein